MKNLKYLCFLFNPAGHNQFFRCSAILHFIRESKHPCIMWNTCKVGRIIFLFSHNHEHCIYYLFNHPQQAYHSISHFIQQRHQFTHCRNKAFESNKGVSYNEIPKQPKNSKEKSIINERKVIILHPFNRCNMHLLHLWYNIRNEASG